MGIDLALAFAVENRNRFLEDLKQLVNIPSISALESHRGELGRCAEALVRQMQASGLSARVLNPGDGVPLVYGEWTGAPGQPTLLIYGHYDVVVAENESAWKTKPFEVVVKDGSIWGRGTTDDKGQLLTAIKAAESLLKTEKHLPVNVKFLIEGEEETDSATLGKALARPEIMKLLACDAVCVSDGAWHAADVPTMGAGVRGICEFQIDVKGPPQQLHSGAYGGAVPNPVSVLTEMLGKLWDADGRILLPGFYDKVVPITDADRKELSRLPFDEEEFKKEVGVSALRGEKGYTPRERTWCRPAMDIVGICGGYTGEGPKSAIPTSAFAKVSIRLVANQDSEEMGRVVERYFREICPPGVELAITFFCLGDPYLTRLDDPMLGSARRAMAETFGKEPTAVRTGGSLPIVPVLHRNLKAPIILCNLGLPDDGEHSENEHFPIEQFTKGIEMYIRLFHAYARGR